MENLSLSVGKYELSLMINKHQGEHYVAVKPLCEALGLQSHKQIERLKRNPQFNCTHMGSVGGDGKTREMECIPVCEVGMFLCTINANRVSEHVRPQLIDFQRHLQVVIHDHLTGNLTMQRLHTLEAIIERLQSRIDILETQQGLNISHAGRQLAAQKQALRSIN